MILSNDHIKNVITEYFKDKPVTKVYLFGSYAKGEADENSDVDLLIDIDFSKKIGWAFYGWTSELEEKLNKTVDIIANAQRPIEVTNWDFIVKINKEKKTLYEKE